MPATSLDYDLNLSIDYVMKMIYRLPSSLMRGVSGDDPAGGAGSGVDSGRKAVNEKPGAVARHDNGWP
jgi:hypothetical protein